MSKILSKEDLESIQARADNTTGEKAVLDRSALLGHIEELDKQVRGLRAQKIGMLMLAQSVTGVSYDAVRADARSKLISKYPEFADDWDLV